MRGFLDIGYQRNVLQAGLGAANCDAAIAAMSSSADGGKGKVRGLGAVLSAPLLKKPPVAQRNVIALARDRVRAAARSIHSAVPSSSAKLPIGVSSTTQWPSPSCHSVRHFSYSNAATRPSDRKISSNARPSATSDSVSMRCLCVSTPGLVIGQAFVRHCPAPVIVAYPQDLSAGAHAAVRRVVKNVAFECARCMQREAGDLSAARRDRAGQ